MAKPLQRLSSQHHAAVRMRVAGVSNAEMARELGVQRRTLYIWFGDALVRRELERQLRRVNELFAARLASSALRAIEALREVLEAPVEGPVTPEHKLAAIREALDRCPFTAKAEDRALLDYIACPSPRCPMRS